MRELNKNNNTNGDRNCIGDQGLEEIKVTDIRIGDLLVVRPGDLIPADGTIITGQAQIDESALTGEPLLKNKGISDQVFSGTINSGGNAFEIQASKLSEDSQYAKIVQLVRKAQEEKAPIQRLADRYALWFTPVTLAISGIGWLVTQNPQTILSVLVVATPCSLIFATPVAIMSGINRCAKIGIIIKTGAAIEQIGKSQAVVFDKTGTITYGSPFIEDIVVLTKDGKIRQKEDDDNNSINNNNNSNAIIASDNSNYSDDLLLKAAAIEQMSTHPAARVIVQKAKEKLGNSLLSTPRNFHEIAGAGVEGDINDEHIIVGSQSLFEDNDNDNDSKKYQLQQQQQQQKQQSELEYDKELLLNTIKKTSQRENDSIIKY
jgi:cation transport ATPase